MEDAQEPRSVPKIGLLVGPLYEDIEVHFPLLRLAEDGAEIQTIDFEPEAAYGGRFWSEALAARGRSSAAGSSGRVYVGVHGMPVAADVTAEEADPSELSALVIPGGYVADHLRRSPAVLNLVRALIDANRPVAAICHGPWVLSSAGVLSGREVTGHWVIKPDLEGAGATWRNEPVVIDGPIVTSRYPDDLPAFCSAILAAVAAGFPEVARV
jgi:protease I